MFKPNGFIGRLIKRISASRSKGRSQQSQIQFPLRGSFSDPAAQQKLSAFLDENYGPGTVNAWKFPEYSKEEGPLCGFSVEQPYGMNKPAPVIDALFREELFRSKGTSDGAMLSSSNPRLR
jgi:hypothetical protein